MICISHKGMCHMIYFSIFVIGDVNPCEGNEHSVLWQERRELRYFCTSFEDKPYLKRSHFYGNIK